MSDDLTQVLQAVADPTRRAILDRLRRGDASVSALAEPFDMTLPGVTKHVRVLERAGLVSRRRVARERICSLRPARLRQAFHWLEDYRVFWEQSFDRLDALLVTLTSEDGDGEG